MKRKGFALTPPLLRVILSVTMILIILLAFGIWQFGYHKLKGVAANVASTNQQANASQDSLTKLQSLQKQLDEHQDTAKKAAEIVATSQGYHYQNQITEDLERCAADAGVSIESYTFSSDSSSGGATSGTSSTPTTTPTTPATGGTSQSTSGGSKLPSVSGLKTVTETVSLKSPLSYNNYLRFLYDIQQNSLKMQVTGLSLSQGADGLSSQDLTIQAYIQ